MCARLHLIASKGMVQQFTDFTRAMGERPPGVRATPGELFTAVYGGVAAARIIAALYVDGEALGRKRDKALSVASYYKTKPPENKAKTHCPRGHEYSESNTRISMRVSRGGRAERTCRTCASALGKIRKRKKKGLHLGISAS
jgi:hypothetical protein